MCAGPVDCGGYWCPECVPLGERAQNDDGSWTAGTSTLWMPPPPKLPVFIIIICIVLFSIFVGWYLSTTANAQSNEDLVWVVTVKDQKTYDFADIQFFELRRGAEAAVISIQGNSELARFLTRNEGKRVVLSLQSTVMER